MEHNKDVGPKLDPLAHIPTNPEGMWDDSVQFQKRKQDPLSHIKKGDNFGDGLATAGALHKDRDPLSHKNNAIGKIETGLTDKNGNVQTFTSDPATHNLGNNHPTVKPVALMKYLIKLVAPQGAHILDPFMGSGSTGMAAKEMGYKFTGIEMDANYVDICIRRIEATKTDPKHTLFTS